MAKGERYLKRDDFPHPFGPVMRRWLPGCDSNDKLFTNTSPAGDTMGTDYESIRKGGEQRKRRKNKMGEKDYKEKRESVEEERVYVEFDKVGFDNPSVGDLEVVGLELQEHVALVVSLLHRFENVDHF